MTMGKTYVKDRKAKNEGRKGVEKESVPPGGWGVSLLEETGQVGCLTIGRKGGSRVGSALPRNSMRFFGVLMRKERSIILPGSRNGKGKALKRVCVRMGA